MLGVLRRQKPVVYLWTFLRFGLCVALKLDVFLRPVNFQQTTDLIKRVVVLVEADKTQEYTLQKHECMSKQLISIHIFVFLSVTSSDHRYYDRSKEGSQVTSGDK